MQRLFPLLLLACLLTACGSDADTNGAGMDTVTDRQPDADEPATDPNAWVDLFNGKDLSGWHTYGQDTVGQAWKVNDAGELYLDVSDKGEWQVNNGGDIVTDDAYGNYELELEWNIGKCGNSGIIYNVVERDDYEFPWLTGPEMQILDNTCHPDAEYPNHRAGDLYDLVAVSEETVRPAGEWNQVRLVVRDGEVEHWLNDKKVVVYQNDNDAWRQRIAGSKFKDFGSFGSATAGKISLQDHGDPVRFRNIRIRPLAG